MQNDDAERDGIEECEQIELCRDVEMVGGFVEKGIGARVHVPEDGEILDF